MANASRIEDYAALLSERPIYTEAIASALSPESNLDKRSDRCATDHDGTSKYRPSNWKAHSPEESARADLARNCGDGDWQEYQALVLGRAARCAARVPTCVHKRRAPVATSRSGRRAVEFGLEVAMAERHCTEA